MQTFYDPQNYLTVNICKFKDRWWIYLDRNIHDVVDCFQLVAEKYKNDLPYYHELSNRPEMSEKYRDELATPFLDYFRKLFSTQANMHDEIIMQDFNSDDVITDIQKNRYIPWTTYIFGAIRVKVSHVGSFGDMSKNPYIVSSEKIEECCNFTKQFNGSDEKKGKKYIILNDLIPGPGQTKNMSVSFIISIINFLILIGLISLIIFYIDGNSNWINLELIITLPSIYIAILYIVYKVRNVPIMLSESLPQGGKVHP